MEYIIKYKYQVSHISYLLVQTANCTVQNTQSLGIQLEWKGFRDVWNMNEHAQSQFLSLLFASAYFLSCSSWQWMLTFHEWISQLHGKSISGVEKKNNYFNKLWINDEGQICEVWVHHEVFALRVNYCSWIGRWTISTLLTENIGILLLMYFHFLTSIPYLHHANRKRQNLNIHDIFSFCMFFICVNVGALQGVKKSLSRYIHILYSQLYCGWFLWGVVRLD